MFETNEPISHSETTCIPLVKYVPMWQETGITEYKLFKDDSDLQSRVNEDFINGMSKEFIEDKKKYEEKIKQEEEKKKTLFLKKKWFKILDSLNKNYNNVDIENMDTEVIEEIKRCMLIPSMYLRTKLQKDCKQCSKELWKDQERYKPIRHPNDQTLDFDGHFPEDHICLRNFEEKNESEKKSYISMKNCVDYNVNYVYD